MSPVLGVGGLDMDEDRQGSMLGPLGPVKAREVVKADPVSTRDQGRLSLHLM